MGIADHRLAHLREMPKGDLFRNRGVIGLSNGQKLKLQRGARC